MSERSEPTDRLGNTPDVSVVVPVYNTMPYLTKCLMSLVEQSIGRQRLEVIAVDDGSTDGSAKELDRFARLYPDTVTVVHQANSGGPAAPCNRGLGLATGRYLFFVGADDYLGPEALERMVSTADRYGSDVLVCKVVGVHSRYVHQEVFAKNDPDIGLFDSALPWSLANTKLFRRDLVERHGVRYPEDMPIGSDQPFTLEACFRARRISVLADYDYYYAVRRLNARNITYLSRHEERLRCVEALMAFVAELIQPGPERDAILVRHFSLEVAKLLEDDFLRLDRAVQEKVHAGVRKLIEQHLTDTISDQLGVETRLRLSVARKGTLSDLLAVIRQDAEQGIPPTVVEGDRWYAAYPGFRDGAGARPDSWFDVTARAADWIAKLDATAFAWESRRAGRRVLMITARSPLRDLPALCTTPIRVSAGELPGVTTAAAGLDGGGTTVLTRFNVDRLLAESAPLGERRAIRAHVNALGRTGMASMRSPRQPALLPMVCRRGARLYVVTPRKDHSGQLMITVAPVTPGRVIARLRGMLPRRGRSQQ